MNSENILEIDTSKPYKLGPGREKKEIQIREDAEWDAKKEVEDGLKKLQDSFVKGLYTVTYIKENSTITELLIFSNNLDIFSVFKTPHEFFDDTIPQQERDMHLGWRFIPIKNIQNAELINPNQTTQILEPFDTLQLKGGTKKTKKQE